MISTDRKIKDRYLRKIRFVLCPSLLLCIKPNLERLKEIIFIIYSNSSRDWFDKFMNEEVIPLLNRYGISVEWKA